MIRPLRRRHRVTVSVLAVVLPVLFVAGLLTRRPPAVMETLPGALRPDSGTSSILLAEEPGLWGDAAITTRLYADGTPAARLAVALRPDAYLKAPDILVYWHPTRPTDDAVPDGAYLLGTLAGTHAQRFILPDTALRADGHLMLYSLGHRQVIATAGLASKQP